MYRHLLLLLLCQAVAPAPQALTDSDITYVKLQPPNEAPTAPSHYRESRIENLPLTIPGNIILEENLNDKTGLIRNTREQLDTAASSEYRESKIEKLPLIIPGNISLEGNSNERTEYREQTPRESIPSLIPRNASSEEENLGDIVQSNINSEPVNKQYIDHDLTLPESSILSEITALPENAEPEIDLPENTSVPEIADISDVVPDGTALPESIETTGEELLEPHSDIQDTIPSETYQSERRGRTYDSLETTDIFEDITEKYATDIPLPRIKPTAKYVPKLSYFQKPQTFVSFPTNSLEKSTKRKFRSHCRCEKIWNCPKLQISVPRCPNEYFLCCF